MQTFAPDATCMFFHVKKFGNPNAVIATKTTTDPNTANPRSYKIPKHNSAPMSGWDVVNTKWITKFQECMRDCVIVLGKMRSYVPARELNSAWAQSFEQFKSTSPLWKDTDTAFSKLSPDDGTPEADVAKRMRDYMFEYWFYASQSQRDHTANQIEAASFQFMGKTIRTAFEEVLRNHLGKQVPPTLDLEINKFLSAWKMTYATTGALPDPDEVNEDLMRILYAPMAVPTFMSASMSDPDFDVKLKKLLPELKRAVKAANDALTKLTSSGVAVASGSKTANEVTKLGNYLANADAMTKRYTTSSSFTSTPKTLTDKILAELKSLIDAIDSLAKSIDLAATAKPKSPRTTPPPDNSVYEALFAFTKLDAYEMSVFNATDPKNFPNDKDELMRYISQATTLHKLFGKTLSTIFPFKPNWEKDDAYLKRLHPFIIRLKTIEFYKAKRISESISGAGKKLLNYEGFGLEYLAWRIQLQLLYEAFREQMDLLLAATVSTFRADLAKHGNSADAVNFRPELCAYVTIDWTKDPDNFDGRQNALLLCIMKLYDVLYNNVRPEPEVIRARAWLGFFYSIIAFSRHAIDAEWSAAAGLAGAPKDPSIQHKLWSLLYNGAEDLNITGNSEWAPSAPIRVQPAKDFEDDPASYTPLLIDEDAHETEKPGENVSKIPKAQGGEDILCLLNGIETAIKGFDAEFSRCGPDTARQRAQLIANWNLCQNTLNSLRKFLAMKSQNAATRNLVRRRIELAKNFMAKLELHFPAPTSNDEGNADVRRQVRKVADVGLLCTELTELGKEIVDEHQKYTAACAAESADSSLRNTSAEIIDKLCELTKRGTIVVAVVESILAEVHSVLERVLATAFAGAECKECKDTLLATRQGIVAFESFVWYWHALVTKSRAENFVYNTNDADAVHDACIQANDAVDAVYAAMLVLEKHKLNTAINTNEENQKLQALWEDAIRVHMHATHLRSERTHFPIAPQKTLGGFLDFNLEEFAKDIGVSLPSAGTDRDNALGDANNVSNAEKHVNDFLLSGYLLESLIPKHKKYDVIFTDNVKKLLYAITLVCDKVSSNEASTDPMPVIADPVSRHESHRQAAAFWKARLLFDYIGIVFEFATLSKIQPTMSTTDTGVEAYDVYLKDVLTTATQRMQCPLATSEQWSTSADFVPSLVYFAYGLTLALLRRNTLQKSPAFKCDVITAVQFNVIRLATMTRDVTWKSLYESALNDSLDHADQITDAHNTLSFSAALLTRIVTTARSHEYDRGAGVFDGIGLDTNFDYGHVQNSIRQLHDTMYDNRIDITADVFCTTLVPGGVVVSKGLLVANDLANNLLKEYDWRAHPFSKQIAEMAIDSWETFTNKNNGVGKTRVCLEAAWAILETRLRDNRYEIVDEYKCLSTGGAPELSAEIAEMQGELTRLTEKKEAGEKTIEELTEKLGQFTNGSNAYETSKTNVLKELIAKENSARTGGNYNDELYKRSLDEYLNVDRYGDTTLADAKQELLQQFETAAKAAAEDEKQLAEEKKAAPDADDTSDPKKKKTKTAEAKQAAAASALAALRAEVVASVADIDFLEALTKLTGEHAALDVTRAELDKAMMEQKKAADAKNADHLADAGDADKKQEAETARIAHAAVVELLRVTQAEMQAKDMQIESEKARYAERLADALVLYKKGIDWRRAKIAKLNREVRKTDKGIEMLEAALARRRARKAAIEANTPRTLVEGYQKFITGMRKCFLEVDKILCAVDLFHAKVFSRKTRKKVADLYDEIVSVMHESKAIEMLSAEMPVLDMARILQMFAGPDAMNDRPLLVDDDAVKIQCELEFAFVFGTDYAKRTDVFVVGEAKETVQSPMLEKREIPGIDYPTMSTDYRRQLVSTLYYMKNLEQTGAISGIKLRESYYYWRCRILREILLLGSTCLLRPKDASKEDLDNFKQLNPGLVWDDIQDTNVPGAVFAFKLASCLEDQAEKVEKKESECDVADAKEDASGEISPETKERRRRRTAEYFATRRNCANMIAELKLQSNELTRPERFTGEGSTSWQRAYAAESARPFELATSDLKSTLEYPASTMIRRMIDDDGIYDVEIDGRLNPYDRPALAESMIDELRKWLSYGDRLQEGVTHKLREYTQEDWNLCAHGLAVYGLALTLLRRSQFATTAMKVYWEQCIMALCFERMFKYANFDDFIGERNAQKSYQNFQEAMEVKTRAVGVDTDARERNAPYDRRRAFLVYFVGVPQVIGQHPRETDAITSDKVASLEEKAALAAMWVVAARWDKYGINILPYSKLFKSEFKKADNPFKEVKETGLENAVAVTVREVLKELPRYNIEYWAFRGKNNKQSEAVFVINNSIRCVQDAWSVVGAAITHARENRISDNSYGKIRKFADELARSETVLTNYQKQAYVLFLDAAHDCIFEYTNQLKAGNDITEANSLWYITELFNWVERTQDLLSVVAPSRAIQTTCTTNMFRSCTKVMKDAQIQFAEVKAPNSTAATDEARVYAQHYGNLVEIFNGIGNVTPSSFEVATRISTYSMFATALDGKPNARSMTNEVEDASLTKNVLFGATSTTMQTSTGIDFARCLALTRAIEPVFVIMRLSETVFEECIHFSVANNHAERQTLDDDRKPYWDRQLQVFFQLHSLHLRACNAIRHVYDEDLPWNFIQNIPEWIEMLLLPAETEWTDPQKASVLEVAAAARQFALNIAQELLEMPYLITDVALHTKIYTCHNSLNAIGASMAENFKSAVNARPTEALVIGLDYQWQDLYKIAPRLGELPEFLDYDRDAEYIQDLEKEETARRERQEERERAKKKKSEEEERKKMVAEQEKAARGEKKRADAEAKQLAQKQAETKRKQREIDEAARQQKAREKKKNDDSKTPAPSAPAAEDVPRPADVLKTRYEDAVVAKDTFVTQYGLSTKGSVARIRFMTTQKDAILRDFDALTEMKTELKTTKSDSDLLDKVDRLRTYWLPKVNELWDIGFDIGTRNTRHTNLNPRGAAVSDSETPPPDATSKQRSRVEARRKAKEAKEAAEKEATENAKKKTKEPTGGTKAANDVDDEPEIALPRRKGSRLQLDFEEDDEPKVPLPNTSGGGSSSGNGQKGPLSGNDNGGGNNEIAGFTLSSRW